MRLPRPLTSEAPSRPGLAALGIAASVLAVGCARSSDRHAGVPPSPTLAGDRVAAMAARGQVPLPTQGKDVLLEARRMNAAGSPPSQFRPGRVSPRQLDPSALSRTAGRFEVQLPSGSPVTTPAIHQGKLFVGGGFHSKEFYAIDARTGQLAWGLDLDDDGPSTPACEDGVCVFNTESCTVYAVAADTGELLWSWWLGDPLMSAPTIAAGRVFTAYPVTAHHGFDPDGIDGPMIDEGYEEPLRQRSPGSIQPDVFVPGLHSPPVGEVDGEPAPGPFDVPVPPPAYDVTLPAGATHALAAFDLRTGRVLWQRWIDADVMSAPVAYRDAVYATSFAGTVYAFDRDDGRILAARADRATSAPTVAQGKLFYTRRTDETGPPQEGIAVAGDVGGDVGAVEGTFQKEAPYLDPDVQRATAYFALAESLDAGNGFGGGAPASANAGVAMALVGQGNVSSLQAFQGSRLLNVAGINVSSMGDEVVGTDPATGRKRWAYRLSGDAAAAGGFLAAPPAAAGGHLLIGTLAGHLQLVEPASGKLVRTFELSAPIRSQPVAEGGWVYIGTTDGRIVAIDTGDPRISGWPQWGRDAARSSTR